MFDRQATQCIKPAVDRIACRLHAVGVGADALSFTGFAVGVLIDGLDGAVARLTRPTDRGGFLDITLDFLFYASIPLAFAVAPGAQRACGRGTAGASWSAVPRS